MSRGHGKIQAEILRHLKPSSGLWDSIAITAAVFDQNPVTASQHVSTRRALRRLAAEGLIVEIGHGFHDGRKRWASPEAAAKYEQRKKAVLGR